MERIPKKTFLRAMRYREPVPNPTYDRPHLMSGPGDNSRRDVLFSIDNALQRLGRDVPGHSSLVEVAGAYHT